GASDPGQVVAVLGGPLEQVEVDLRGGLTRPDEGDALPAQQLVADVEVTGAVRGRAAETLRHGRDHRLGPDPEDDVAGTKGGRRPARPTCGHRVGPVLLPFRRGDLVPPADGVELAGDPPAVLVVLGPEGVEVLPDVEGVEAAHLLEVVE